MSIESEFKNPGNTYRGIPFWSWNDDLDPEELRRQVRTMLEAGIGGGFMHARVGLITPYMGEKWMECIRATVDEAKKTGFEAWLYDEDKWPSGDHSGQVRAGRPEFEAKRLHLAEFEITEEGVDFQPRPEPLATFVVKKHRRHPLRLTDVRRVEDDGIDPGKLAGYTILHFSMERRGYADLMRADAMRRFLDLCYEAYLQEVGDEFGKAIPGIFTDEPNYLYPPWTEALPERFLEDKGYDLVDRLPALFYEAGDFRKVRYDYYDTATNLFREAFSEQIYHWCEQHNLPLTGHYLLEDDLVAQTRVIGSAMEHYEYMQVPGIDHLTRRIRDPVLVKQCSSVCHQFGGRRMLTETYGCAGWNCSFEDQKWIGEWQCVLGADLICQHLQLYSLRGCRKRDYPPSYQQQPWYEKYPLFSDYLARVCAAMTAGRHVTELVVLHPMGTAWAEMSPLDEGRAREYSDAFAQLSQLLSEMNRDYDYADEKIMARHAQVEDGKLVVGDCAYSAVILPKMDQLRETTLRLLADFLDAGGTVIGVGGLPTRLEGEKSDLIKELLGKRVQRVRPDFNSMEKALRRVIKRDVIVSADGQDTAPIFHQHRDLGERQLYYFANTSNRQGFERVSLRMRGHGGLELWDLATGEIRDIPGVKEGPFTVAHVDFAPAQSWLFGINAEKELIHGTLPRQRPTQKQSLGRRWAVARRDHNSLTLDYCQYKPEKGKWSEVMPHWRVQRELGQPEKPVPVTLRYSFRSELRPTDLTRFWLVVEQPEKCQIKLNGGELPSEDEGWWCDIAFRKIPARDLLKRGNNTVELTVSFDGEFEVEAIYLLGDFDVSNKRSREFALVKRAGQVSRGDLVGQGMPMFRGRIALEQVVTIKELSAQRAFLEFDGLEAIVASVTVNNRDCGDICWRPHRVEVTDALREGDNVVRVELYNSCRNLLGPHHHKAGELLGVTPHSFTEDAGVMGAHEGERGWVDHYNFVPFGILGGAQIVWVEEI
ncbi:MAG: glycosyl hydrolase [Armatimonadota bacterium]